MDDGNRARANVAIVFPLNGDKNIWLPIENM